MLVVPKYHSEGQPRSTRSNMAYYTSHIICELPVVKVKLC